MDILLFFSVLILFMTVVACLVDSSTPIIQRLKWVSADLLLFLFFAGMVYWFYIYGETIKIKEYQSTAWANITFNKPVKITVKTHKYTGLIYSRETIEIACD